MSLKGKVAIITGAGQGIGRVIAMRLAAEGACVVIGDINPVTAQHTAKEIEEKGNIAISTKWMLLITAMQKKSPDMPLKNLARSIFWLTMPEFIPMHR